VGGENGKGKKVGRSKPLQTTHFEEPNVKSEIFWCFGNYGIEIATVWPAEEKTLLEYQRSKSVSFLSLLFL